MEDDLDSFFNELNEIEAVQPALAESSANGNGAESHNSDEHVRKQLKTHHDTSSTNNTTVTTTIPTTNVIYGQTIERKEVIVKSSHPVYTYPVDNTIDSNTTQLDAPIATYTSHAYTQGRSIPNSQPPPPTTTRPSHLNSAGDIVSSVNTSNPTSVAPTNPKYVPVMPKPDKKFVRKGADEVWIDDTLKEWPENDYRIFVGDLAKDVSTDMLAKKFQHYPSYAMAKVTHSTFALVQALQSSSLLLIVVYLSNV